MADLVRQDPRAYVRLMNLLSVPIYRGRDLSHRDGGFSTDRTVINTDGDPTRRTPQRSSYVKRFPVHSSQSHTHSRIPILPPRSPWPLKKQLQDPNGHIIARLAKVTPTKYNIGDVYHELHYIRSAGAGVVVSVPLDPVVIFLFWARLPHAVQPLGALLPRPRGI